MTNDIDRDGVAKAYARWAPVYDLVFGAVFEKGRRASIEARRPFSNTAPKTRS